MTDVYVLVVARVLLLDLAGIGDTFGVAVDLGASYKIHYIGPAAVANSSIGPAVSGLAPLPETLPDGAIVIVPGAVRASVDYATPAAADGDQVAHGHRDIRPSHVHRLFGCVPRSEGGAPAGKDVHDAPRSDRDPRAAVSRPVRLAEPNFCTRRQCADQRRRHDGRRHGAAADLQRRGPGTRTRSCRQLVVYFRRSGADPQLSPWLLHRNHIHTAVHRAQDAVTRNPAASWTLHELASVACTSPRHLARLFQLHAGISPLNYVRQIRTAAAKEIVGQSRLSMEAIAEMVGFTSAEQMRRAWLRFEGVNPTERRRALGAADLKCRDEA